MAARKKQPGKQLEVRLELVPAPADYEERCARAFKAYCRLLARAALRTRCVRCGRCDAIRAGRGTINVIVCDECGTCVGAAGPDNEVAARRIMAGQTASKSGSSTPLKQAS